MSHKTHSSSDPVSNLALLTKAGKTAPLPNPGRSSLRAWWSHMIRGGADRIYLRQLRLRRAKAGNASVPSDDSPSAGLRLLRRTLAGFGPRELAFILPEDSLRAVWEVADGDDGLIWCVAIKRELERESGSFTDEELDAWSNLDGSVGGISALLDRILSEHRSPPSRRPPLLSRLFGGFFRHI